MRLQSAKLVLQVTGSETVPASLPKRILSRHRGQQPLRSNSCTFSSNSCLHRRERDGNSLPTRLSFSRAQFQHHPSGKVQVSLHANRHFPRGSFICTHLYPPHQPGIQPAEQSPPRTGKCCQIAKNIPGKAGIGNAPPRKSSCLAQLPSAEGCSPRTDASRKVKDTAQVKSTSFAL